MTTEWESWKISPENECHMDDLLTRFQSQNISSPSLWWRVFSYGSSSCCESSEDQRENETELNEKELDIVNEIKESLVASICVEETSFAGISYNSFTKIFNAVGNEMDENTFSTFCQFVASWKNDFLIEQALKAVVLPKGKKESPVCLIYTLTELAKEKPNQLCDSVLIALLTDSACKFEDVELISSLYEALPTPQRDLVILRLTKKQNIKELDWLFLQTMVRNITAYSAINLLECIQKWSNKFTKSLVFGKFLVNFCKYSSYPHSNRESLLSAVEKHETIFKKQALKLLQQ